METLTIGQKFEIWCKKKVPLFSAFFLMIISLVPFNIPEASAIKPCLSMICIYYWALYRPDIFGYGSTFSLGLTEDILGAAPLGTSCLTFIIIYWITLDQRRYLVNKPFHVTWAGYAIVSFVAFMIKYILTSIIYSNFIPFSSVFFHFLVILCFYPFISWVCTKIQTSALKDI